MLASPPSDKQIAKEYPDIYGKDKLGKVRIWKASVFHDGPNTAMSVIQHGIYGGKLQMDTRQYTEGKNIGKKNETSPLVQCMLEVEKKRKDKMEKEGYSETRREAAEELICINKEAKGDWKAKGDTTVNSLSLTKHSDWIDRKYFPMLANKYEPASTAKKRGGIVFPCFVQPKLDGLRCVVYLPTATSDRPVYQSRTGGYFTVLRHLDSSLMNIFAASFEPLVLDGELYTPDIPFEELAGIIKKKTLTAEDAKRIQCVQYHVYDIIQPDVPFHQRLLTIQQMIPATTDGASVHSVVAVPTYFADSMQTFRNKFGEYVAQGYEGIMLRNTAGLYKENYRSNDLMKYKEFFEAEYVIVDYKEASGRDAGTVIWECETPERRRFSVRPRGTLDSRREWFANATAFVGKQLTVIYQELSEMGVPRFPVGKCIRDGY